MTNIYSGQINSIEESYNENDFDQGALPEEDPAEDDFGNTQTVDAYFAQVNMTETQQIKHPWFLDSGASHHVTGERQVFTTLKPSSGTRITTAGGQGHNVMGIGNVAIKLPSSEIQKIEHVLYSPGIVKNLLPVGFLTSRGLALEFQAEHCTIRNSLDDIITTAIREFDSGLYKLLRETMLQCSESLLTQVDKPLSTSMLWHRRMGHTHYQGIWKMLQHKVVQGFPSMIVQNLPCKICSMDK